MLLKQESSPDAHADKPSAQTQPQLSQASPFSDLGLTWLQVIGDVLDECGSNIDAAIKRLEQLRLSGNNAPEAAQDPTAAGSEGGVQDSWGGSSLFIRPRLWAPPLF